MLNKKPSKKVQLALLPPSGIIYGSLAMTDGATKYGAYQWRGAKVSYMQYLSAMLRHVMSLIDREDEDAQSKVHHGGHIIAGMSIVLDALEQGNLIDDRPLKGSAAALLRRKELK